MSKLIKIYTDGSSIGNPGPGGYGIVMLSGDGEYKKEFSQGFKTTTNNRMELLAVIIGLENLKFKNCNVKIYTDSKYVSDAVEKGWLFNWVKKETYTLPRFYKRDERRRTRLSTSSSSSKGKNFLVVVKPPLLCLRSVVDREEETVMSSEDSR